jgi:hypothetical protein
MVFWMLAAGFAGAAGLKLLYLPDLWDTLRRAPAEALRRGGRRPRRTPAASRDVSESDTIEYLERRSCGGSGNLFWPAVS